MVAQAADRVLGLGLDVRQELRIRRVTDRFKAAHSEVSISNLQKLAVALAHRTILCRQYFGKTPLEDPEIYRKLSPLTYAGRVKTPLLLTQNEKDEKVPVEQAVEFFRAVQTTGTPVQLHIYPGESHGTMMPNHQLDKLRKTESWFQGISNEDRA